MICLNCHKNTTFPFILSIYRMSLDETTALPFYEMFDEIFCDILCCRNYYGIQRDSTFLANFRESVKKYKALLDRYILMNKINHTDDSEEVRALHEKYKFIHYEYNIIPLLSRQKSDPNFLDTLRKREVNTESEDLSRESELSWSASD